MRTIRRTLLAVELAALAAAAAQGGWTTLAIVGVAVALVNLPWPARIGLRRVSLPLAGFSWGAVGLGLLLAPAAHAIRALHDLHPLHAGSVAALADSRLAAPWEPMIDLLLAGALIFSVLAVRSLTPARELAVRAVPAALDRARALVHRYGEDSIAPFILRPDKSFAFEGEAVLAYRMIGETAVVSGDPVGPDGDIGRLLTSFMTRARQAGVDVVLYGASGRYLERYRDLGLRSMCVGEEAVVDPSGFSLDGRPVRKLRQSVHRVERRGWRVEVCQGRHIDQALEAAIDDLESAWRAGKKRLIGFAMSMGPYDFGVRPDDVYALAFSPEGRLQACMRFLCHGGSLSLDTMRRVGDTPNGLNEALVCRTLEYARSAAVPQVSLNYAGLSHLVRGPLPGNRLTRWVIGRLIGFLSGRFQMERLVLFNQKFSPSWRRRYLVYDRELALPRSVFRVLQAEGYLRHREPARAPEGTISVAGIRRHLQGRLGG
ncbi:MAG TPA: DUF2156 domain-containing protein [Solirubrobacteraceae bacterium]|nr:DUF2156 domain-containing protein [Solirubrobacteraceae bacterium]